MSVSRAIPFTHEQVLQLRQAIMEMGQNAIEWGNRHRSDKLVDITYRIYDDRVEIVVRDQGAGLRPRQAPPRRLGRRPDRPHGRPREAGAPRGGVRPADHRGMVDEMRYNDVGNEVTLIKRFRPDRRPRPTDARAEPRARPAMSRRAEPDPGGRRRRARGAPLAPRPVPARLPRPDLRAGAADALRPWPRSPTSTSSSPTSGCPR